MARSLTDATLALAGLYQAAGLVHEVAHRGRAPEDLMEVCIRSLFVLDPPDTASVYGGTEGLRAGLRLLRDQFGERTTRRDFEITRYVVSVLHLERKLMKQPVLLSRLREGIERVRAQVRHFSSYTHGSVIAALAGLYVGTVGTLTPRIIVRGEHGYLSNPDNANKVRALLLAAIRSAVLWRQCGGNRFQLLLRRRQIAREAQRLIA